MVAARAETFRARQLRLELLRLRTTARLTLDDVAAELDWSSSKISRIESGRNGVSPSDVRLLLDVYGVRDHATREKLVELARAARRKGWWHAYPEVFRSAYATAEADAVTISTYESDLVPGLLQTADYQTALLRACRPDLRDAEIERRLAARAERRAILTRSDPPRLMVVVGEAVLRRPVGGRKVMRGQLTYLIELAESPWMSFQILPSNSGSHAGRGVSFVLLDLAEGGRLGVVFLEHLTGHLFLEAETDVARYREEFSVLVKEAMDPEESIALIRRSLAEM
ncbi:helix-turn-helix domain-containing protein [Bailinhaonella thermotolerans]|nr:helix-turn-helix transcriptional regulator [Bailinhaonella thermotolerans]